MAEIVEMTVVDPEKPWKGGRWIVRTEAGPRYLLTLAMILFDSSGTNKDASLQEHREAVRSVITSAKAAREADAILIVDAASAAVTARASFDPELLAMP